MLKRGAAAIKFGRNGKGHEAVFRLSQDETVLSWEDSRSGLAGSLSSLAGSVMGKKRSVRIADCASLLVGAESEVFRRSIEGEGDVSLCLSLLIASTDESGSKEKDSLDVRCTDDVSFAHWVAALNVLLADAANAAAGGIGAEQERRARSLARSAPRLHKELIDRETAAEAELKAQAEAEAARWLAKVDRRAQLTGPGFTL